MNDQPKLSHADFPMTPADLAPPTATETAHARRVPGGPRGFTTWPIELEAEPWRP
jgi:hypothetical protein